MGKLSRLRGIGRIPVTYELPAMPVHWFSEPRACSRNEAGFFVIGTAGTNMSRKGRIATQILIEASEAQTACDTLRVS